MKLLKSLEIIDKCDTSDRVITSTLALYEKLTRDQNSIGTKLDTNLSSLTGAPEVVFRTFRYFRNDLAHLNKKLFSIEDNLNITIVSKSYKNELKMSIRTLKGYLKKSNLKDIEI